MKKRFQQTICLAALLTTPFVHAIKFDEQGEYMGSPSCLSCHERFYELWDTSFHGTAMQAFSGPLAATLVPMEKPIKIGENEFFIALDKTGGTLQQTTADGEKTSYPILHTLGGKNVYYFLVPLDKGKLQVAPVAYHARQHFWYNTTESMVRHFNDGTDDTALEWTDRQLTFNTGCHDCHVSQLRKNYDAATDSYTTTWSEAGINCEVCHGPAEAHIIAAEEAEARGEELVDMKLVRFHDDLNAKQRDATCAPCHAKMMPLTRDFIPGEEFFDHYDLISYEHTDFFPDGRDLGENYTHTGWMANPCANAGELECIHCHTSSGRFRFKNEPNNSCLPCHQERVKTIAEHSRHAPSNDLSCLSCHMPMTAQSFMIRSDHTFRPPSPAASIEFGSPNACNLCHNNPEAISGNFNGHRREDMDWADQHVKEWFGEDSGEELLRLGHAVLACRNEDWGKLPEIIAFLEDDACDQAGKVAILRLLQNCPDPNKWPAVHRQLKSSNEWVRVAATEALYYDFSSSATTALIKAVQDQFRTVRIRAAMGLMGRDLSRFSDVERAATEKANDEHWNSLIIWPDRWSTHYNQGIYYDRLDKPDEALAAYSKALELRDDVIQPMLNAAIVHARQGDSTNAYELLARALKIEPTNPVACLNMALIEAEFGQLKETEAYLRTALESDPRMAQAAYNLGILLRQVEKEEGFKWLKQAAELDPGNWNYVAGYIAFLRTAGRMNETEGVLTTALASKRAAAEAYFSLAEICQQQGRISEALAIYRKAAFAKHLPDEARRHAIRMESQLRQLQPQPRPN